MNILDAKCSILKECTEIKDVNFIKENSLIHNSVINQTCAMLHLLSLLFK